MNQNMNIKNIEKVGPTFEMSVTVRGGSDAIQCTAEQLQDLRSGWEAGDNSHQNTSNIIMINAALA